jgi:transposase
MPAKQFFVKLSAGEHEALQTMLNSGVAAARSLNHARILLKADQGWGDEDIAQALDVSVRTCERVRQRYAKQGLAAALKHKEQQKRREPKLDGAAEARLIALACSKPPQGREHWTMELLAGELVRLKVVDAISDETVRRTLKKTNSNPG